MKKFRVAVIFEFDDVDENSEEAENIVSMLANDWETLQAAYDAQGVWVDDSYTLTECEL